MFHIGQKVMCIRDEFFQDIPDYIQVVLWPNRPVKGTVYTVRKILPVEGQEALLLHELFNPEQNWRPPYGRCEGAFHSLRFRPIVEHKTDISVFRKMLLTKEEKV